MDLKLLSGEAGQIETDALILLGFEGDSGALDTLTGGLASELAQTGEFTGKSGETALLHRPAGLKAKRLLLAGAGKREKFTPSDTRRLAGAATRTLRTKTGGSAALWLPADLAQPVHVSAAVEGALLATHETDHHKSKRDEKKLDFFAVATPQSSKELTDAVEEGRIIGEAQNFARELANEPPNKLTPTELANRAKTMADTHGLEYEVLDEARMRQLGMGALLGVAQGSFEPPALVILRYKPANGDGSGKHLGLVGKGVTFDTGGISIKPADGMDQMKFDMAGAAAVIGAMQAIAQLKPGVPVTAYVPAVENMPGHKAQRPGDIVKSYSGKTVEILNTDAEGRLILADAITYAKQQGVTHLVNVATLTGAIGMALGAVYAGAFTNNEEFLNQLMQASKTAGEKLWHMPTDDEYREQLKSAYADIPNIGTKGAGATTAALFLKEFVEETPWVHLDIASTAWINDGKPHLAKGPTGMSMRTMVQLARAMGSL